MSWAIEITGTKEGAKRATSEQFDKIGTSYAGKPEGDDIAACRARVIALIDACDLTPDVYGTRWNAVVVKASGSHGWTDKGLTTASFQVSVTRTVIEL